MRNNRWRFSGALWSGMVLDCCAAHMAHYEENLVHLIEAWRKVTVVATSFLRYTGARGVVIPPRAHFTLWLEEMKIPPLGEAAPSDK